MGKHIDSIVDWVIISPRNAMDPHIFFSYPPNRVNSIPYDVFAHYKSHHDAVALCDDGCHTQSILVDKHND